MMNSQIGRSLWILAVICLTLPTCAVAQRAELELSVVDGETGTPMSAMVSITRSNGRAYVPRDFIRIGDSFPISGVAVLRIPTGKYAFMITRGPEYRVAHGTFEIEQGATDNKSVELKRVRDISVEQWYSGDLAIYADPEDASLIMDAADLRFANFVTWTNQQNHWIRNELPPATIQKLESGRIFDAMGGTDWRDAGGLMFSNVKAPINLNQNVAFSSPLDTLRSVESDEESFSVVADVAARDLPLWISTGKVDAVAIASPALSDAGINEPEGSRLRPKDLPKNDETIFWREEVYFHLLNAGLRIIPTACSAAGREKNIPGCNRVFVHCGLEFNSQSWRQNHLAGRVFISNGPLLRVRANDQLPGHVFKSSGNDSLEIDLQANLALQQKAEHLEIIRDGKVLHKIALDDFARQGGRLPKLQFNESGWFMLRVVCGDPNTVRFASTGPYYVEFDESPRISRESTQFFMDWVYERARELKKAGSAESRKLLEEYRVARDFWQKQLDDANAK